MCNGIFINMNSCVDRPNRTLYNHSSLLSFFLSLSHALSLSLAVPSLGSCSQANYTLRLIEVFPNIIERPSLSISTIGRIPLTKQGMQDSLYTLYMQYLCVCV